MKKKHRLGASLTAAAMLCMGLSAVWTVPAAAALLSGLLALSSVPFTAAPISADEGDILVTGFEDGDVSAFSKRGDTDTSVISASTENPHTGDQCMEVSGRTKNWKRSSCVEMQAYWKISSFRVSAVPMLTMKRSGCRNTKQLFVLR